MPINAYFKGHGGAVMSNMQQEYGDKKGKSVFYATANKRGLKPEALGDVVSDTDQEDDKAPPPRQPLAPQRMPGDQNMPPPMPGSGGPPPMVAANVPPPSGIAPPPILPPHSSAPPPYNPPLRPAPAPPQLQQGPELPPSPPAWQPGMKPQAPPPPATPAPAGKPPGIVQDDSYQKMKALIDKLEHEKPGVVKQIFQGLLSMTKARGIDLSPGRTRDIQNLGLLKQQADEERQLQAAQSNEAYKQDALKTNAQLRADSTANAKVNAETRDLAMLDKPGIEEIQPGQVPGSQYRSTFEHGGKMYGRLGDEELKRRQKEAEQVNWLPVPESLQKEFGTGPTAPKETFDMMTKALESRGQHEEARALQAQLAADRLAMQHTIAQEGNATRASISAAGAGNRNDARSDRSFNNSQHELDEIGKPINDTLGRISKLQTTINQTTPQADALIAPELLTAMAGGQGSGLRMNEAEISRVVGGRTNLESLKAALNKWQIDPSKGLSVTPAQRQQMQALITAVAEKANAKKAALMDAYHAIAESDDAHEHRRIVNKAREAFDAVDKGAQGAATTAPAVHTATDAHGNKVQWNGSAWVPVPKAP